MKLTFSPICTAVLVAFLTACTPASSPASESVKVAEKTVARKAPAVKPIAPPSGAAKTIEAKPESKPQPALQVVKEWDFIKQQATKLGWDTYSDHSAGGKDALWIGIEKMADVFNNAVGVKADGVKAFRATFLVIVQKADGTGTPVVNAKARLYWAKPKDMAKGKYPYAETRAISLQQSDPAKPDVWMADLSEQTEWKGDIKSLNLRLYAPEGQNLSSGERVKVILSKCELLK